ncbi:MAG: 1-acyl-sn-glycerol-3-phosphate acyltransferase [Mesorhizobium sp.]|nr:1-acyl-sn-glycerol-3-phosphate acyltransferase [Mesorhizobium sp.]
MTSSHLGTLSGRIRAALGQEDGHVVDQLIAERTTRISRHPLWPVLRPILLQLFHYRQAVDMADRIATMDGWTAFQHISRLLSLDLTTTGLDNIPASGGFILAPNHPTGIADGIAMFDALKDVRPDLTFFANRDALRVAPGFRDLIIPVEWRQDAKTHSKGRDTLEMTARAFAGNRAVVLFPSGRLAYWHEGRLTERPWQNSVAALARRYDYPIVPAHISARNSGLFYFLSKHSTEMRDMTLFHELLNKKGRQFRIAFGRPIQPDELPADASDATAALHHHVTVDLAASPDAVFSPG